MKNPLKSLVVSFLLFLTCSDVLILIKYNKNLIIMFRTRFLSKKEDFFLMDSILIYHVK